MMKDRMHTCSLVFGIFLCMILLGCNLIDSNGSIGNLKPGTFEITITGEVDKTFYGEAVYEILQGLDGTPVFWLRLKEVPLFGDEYRFINVIAGEKPGEGIYDIWNAEKKEPKTDQYYVSYNDSDFKGMHGHYKSTGGKLNILSSRDNQLSGTLNASAFESVHVGDGDFHRVTVNISGEFYAQEGSTGIIMN